MAALPLGITFTIRIDHHPLKNLLNQAIQTPEQQYFLTKLLGYSYDIIYRKGRENLAADALSRLPAEEGELAQKELQLLASEPVADWVDRLRFENNSDKWISEIRDQIVNREAREGFEVRGDFLMFNI